MLTERAFFSLVGSRIRQIRIAAGLSQGEVARRIKSYQQNVGRSEAGTNLTLDVIYRLAVALDVEPIEFFKVKSKRPTRGSEPRPRAR